jgi:hypothetical protein
MHLFTSLSLIIICPPLDKDKGTVYDYPGVGKEREGAYLSGLTQ